MNQYRKISVATDDGRTDVWDARAGRGYSVDLDGGALVIARDGETAAIYSMAHIISAKFE